MKLNPTLRDNINYLSKLTPAKFINVCKLIFSYYLSKWTKKNYHKGLPLAVAIEPTTSCNLRCPECPSGLRAFTRPTGNLKPALFEKTIDSLKKYLTYLTFYFQGEPYINPNFFTLIKYASKNKIYTSTSTNAHFLDDERAKKTIESGLDRLIISIDGTSQETYQSYRVSGTLDKVIEGTKNIIKWKKQLKSRTPYVIFQFLVVKPNEHQIADVFKLAKELGVDKVKLKTAQIYDYKNGSELIPTIDKYSRYRKLKDGKYAIKNKLTHSCWKMWHSCVITWDGKVVPCCFDKDATHQLGEINEKLQFRDVWESVSYSNFRSALLKSRSKIDICKNCTEGTKVWG